MSAANLGGHVLQETCGVVCSSCQAKLRVTQTGVTVGFVMVFAVFFGLIFAAARFRSDVPVDKAFTIVFFLLIFLMLYIHRRIAPRLARLRPMKPGESVLFPLEIHKQAEREDVELLNEVVADVTEHEAARAAQTAPWICPRCKEENPAGFLGCWKCEEPAPSLSNNEVTLSPQS